MHKTIPEEYREKYEAVVEQAEEIFPDHRWLIQTINWTDDTFIIRAVHNRGTLRHGQWKAVIKVGSEQARVPSNPYQKVTYHPDPHSDEGYIVWTNSEHISME